MKFHYNFFREFVKADPTFSREEAEASPYFNAENFSATAIEGQERENAILEVIKELDGNKFDAAGPHKIKKWEFGWGENLEAYRKSHDFKDLIPKFYKQSIMREGDKIWMPENPLFRFYLWDIWSSHIFKKYLQPYSIIYEYGHGTGYNLVKLRQLFPDKKLFGSDWVTESFELINEINQADPTMKLVPFKFDMFHPHQMPMFDTRTGEMVKPDYSDCAVLTLGAMEQLGENWFPFVEQLMDERPGIVVHLEPIVEYYRQGNTLLDYLALRFHTQRNYLRNYLTFLKANRNIEILENTRVNMGTIYQQSWNVVVWRMR